MATSNTSLQELPSSPTAAYTVVEVHDGAVESAVPAPTRLTVTWSNVGVSVPVKNPETKRIDEKQILRGVSGAARPGELLVLMGPSGAGKSTLLDCIAGRNTRATGDVRVNGQPWTKALAKRACYVLQDDLFYGTLSVREHLQFQARLRMPPTSTAAERAARVAAIVSELGLSTALDTPIG
ncbi:hypothetical protein PINS_up019058 [Pythium insidiosum]|nr:hypothetical protein PINS_up019058 [Pythium insidiosum]